MILISDRYYIWVNLIWFGQLLWWCQILFFKFLYLTKLCKNARITTFPFIFRFQLSMINRQSFTSAVAGILSATNLDKNALLTKFCDDVDTTAKAAKAKNFSKREMKNFDDAVWKLTASLILMKPNVDERQLFTLTRAPVILFQVSIMSRFYFNLDYYTVW